MKIWHIVGISAVATLLGAPAAAVAQDGLDVSFLNSVYFQVLGGVALPLNATPLQNSTGATSTAMFFPGYAFAATAGVRVVDGLSVEADVLRTSRNSNEPAPLTPYSLTSTSVMVDAKYTAALNDMFSVYGGVGVGWIRIDNSLLLPDFYSGLGYQLIGGVAAQVADHVSLVGEARFQSTFAPAVYSADPDYVISAPTATVMVGVKVGF